MPKTEIDYSNTIIYKITCKNPAITDVYVGHTTNFVQRKHAHKQSCLNIKAPNHKCKLYEVIRNNGGWANWQMEIINFFNCVDHYAARKKEQEYFILLNATLNSIEPFPKPKIIVKTEKEEKTKPVFFCDTCNIYCGDSTTFDNHNNTKKHKKYIFENSQKITKDLKIYSNDAKTAIKFHCEKCDFNCSKQSNYEKHLSTRKHKTNYNELQKEEEKMPKKYECICGKEYIHRQGLYVHKKKCTYEPPKKPKLYEKNKLYEKEDIMDVLIKENHEFKNIIIEVVKNNAELQKQNHEFQLKMMEMCKKGNNINTNTNNSYNNNKTFNLQFFLNEQCKDAMNLTEFVDSMTLEFSDLEDVGKLGYVEGISKIMIRKLNEMDIYKRPIHCSDSKREIMYVKHENVWEKEKNSNEHIRKAIKRVTHKNGGLLVPWSLENPNCMNLDHHLNDVYLRMMGQSMGGSGEFVDNENKIMKKIAKAVFIDKTC